MLCSPVHVDHVYVLTMKILTIILYPYTVTSAAKSVHLSKIFPRNFAQLWQAAVFSNSSSVLSSQLFRPDCYIYKKCCTLLASSSSLPCASSPVYPCRCCSRGTPSSSWTRRGLVVPCGSYQSDWSWPWTRWVAPVLFPWSLEWGSGFLPRWCCGWLTSEAVPSLPAESPWCTGCTCGNVSQHYNIVNIIVTSWVLSVTANTNDCRFGFSVLSISNSSDHCLLNALKASATRLKCQPLVVELLSHSCTQKTKIVVYWWPWKPHFQYYSEWISNKSN